MKRDDSIFMEYDIDSIEPLEMEGIDLTDIFMKAYDELYTDEASDQEDILKCELQRKKKQRKL